MKKTIFTKTAALIFILSGINAVFQNLKADIPPVGGNKVAYYVFDSHGPDHFSLTSFTDKANIVVVFEGTLWELADSVHYSTGWMKNVVYHSYIEILRDIKILQARGIKVLMNVDDAASWSTTTPFTTYDGQKLDYQQFAEFIKTCAIDSLHLDGISLDIEHKATGNTNYVTLLKEIGKYFGPKSSNSNEMMYIAAIYAGYWGQPASVIGKSKDVSSYFNFVMDMAYFNLDYEGRFKQWADSVGASKTMIGVLNDNNDLVFSTKVAAWQPASSSKAGIMVYAANNLKSYTDSVFSALVMPVTDVADNETHEKEIPHEPALEQNYPNPFNPTTVIGYQLPVAGHVTLKVFDLLGREVATIVDEYKQAGIYHSTFSPAKGGQALHLPAGRQGSEFSSGVYFYRLNAGNFTQVKKMVLAK